MARLDILSSKIHQKDTYYYFSGESYIFSGETWTIFFGQSQNPSSGDASNKVPKISVQKGNDRAPTGISAQPVHSSSSGVPDVRRNRFVERPCRRRVVEVDWKRGLSAVSQWSESNACRPKTEPAEHLHTEISMRATHEKIIDCLRAPPLFASINASIGPQKRYTR